MAWQVIKQPNGRFLIFSSIVDMILFRDCSRAQIEALYIEDSRQKQQYAITRLMDTIERGENPYFQFALSYEEAIKADKKASK